MPKGRSTTRSSKDEVEEIARREILSSLRGTIEDLIGRLEHAQSDADITEWAKAIGATTDCDVSNALIVQPELFAEAAVEHYGMDGAAAVDAYERIKSALSKSGIETGGWGNGQLCAYHNEQAAKND